MIVGIEGNKGSIGQQGDRGQQGDKGDPGIKGPNGIRGIRGSGTYISVNYGIYNQPLTLLETGTTIPLSNFQNNKLVGNTNGNILLKKGRHTIYYKVALNSTIPLSRMVDLYFKLNNVLVDTSSLICSMDRIKTLSKSFYVDLEKDKVLEFKGKSEDSTIEVLNSTFISIQPPTFSVKIMILSLM